MKKLTPLLICLFLSSNLLAQNSLVGDGFGGRLWYKPYNYTVGSYSAYTVCGADKQLYGWGSNGLGQLGIATDIFNSITPIAIPHMDRVSYYSTGYIMGAIKEDQTGWVWGAHVSGGPTQVIQDVKFVDAGANSCAFVKNDGTVWSVGVNYNGVFGNGTTFNNGTINLIPQKMNGISSAVRTAQGSLTTSVLLSNGTVYAAGGGPTLGSGTASDTALSPIQVKNLKDIVDIKSCSYTNIALDKDGFVWIWGGTGNLFLYSNLPVISLPFKLSGLKDIVAISGCNDGFHFLVLNKDKNCYALGNNSSGQCAQPLTTLALDTPILVATDVVDIIAGEWFSYIVKSDGSLWCVGYDGSIWLDLPRQQRSTFAKVDPTSKGFELCNPAEHGNISLLPADAIIFPNAFSPNNDGSNDVFRAIQNPKRSVESFEMKIFNRWGQLVFATKDIHKGWDGELLGEPQPIATYFYSVKYNTTNRQPLYLKGDVTLIR